MVSTTGIVRHPPPQSEWNLENLFTGRHDVALTKKGAARAGAAGVVRAEARIRFDTSHTPLQTHAVVDRALLEHLGNVSDDAISDIDIATGAPRAYSFHERLVVTNTSYRGGRSRCGCRRSTSRNRLTRRFTAAQHRPLPIGGRENA